jgi:protein SCO1/2
MTTFPAMRRRLLRLIGAACAALAPLAFGSELPGDSIYQLHATLTDQDGTALDLASGRGRPVLVSMFYTSCQMTCPMIISSIQHTLKALTPAERDRVRVLMISFDPARDTVEVLKRTARERGCDEHWTLARTGEANARKIAALLGIQYRRLAGGDFSHSSVIEVLDADGRIVARSGMLDSVDPALVQALRQQLSAPR